MTLKTKMKTALTPSVKPRKAAPLPGKKLAKVKVNVLEEGGATSKGAIRAPMRCGECLHHKTSKHPQKEGLCKDEGVAAGGVAPRCFTPNVTQILRSSDEMVVLASLLHGLTHRQRRILMATLMTKPKKLSFGKKVFFLLSGGDYLNNYLMGFVLGYTSSGHLMVSGDPDKNKRGNTYIAYLSDKSVILAKEFKAKKAELIEEGRINDPDSKAKKVKSSVTLDYEPPTMESAPKHWFSKTKKVKKTKKKDVVPLDEIIIQGGA